MNEKMGYPFEQFVGEVDENLICSICRDVMTNPVSCRDGHTFCESCINVWLTSHKACPLDRQPLRKRELIRNLPLRGVIDNLDVRCANGVDASPKKKRKTSHQSARTVQLCPWAGKLKDLEEHSGSCPCELVHCPHTRCVEAMLRRDVEEHALQCQKRSVVCERCGLEMAFCDLDEHERNECPLAMVPCVNSCVTNGCITMVSRAHMDDHVTYECERAPVPCPFEVQGCGTRATRSELSRHLQDSMMEHMLMLQRENKKLKDQLQALNSHVKVEISTLREEQPNTYIWNIANFPQLIEEYQQGEEIRSPAFWLCGVCWKLRLYPNGATPSHSGYLSLYLERQDDEHNVATVGNSCVSTLFRFIVESQNTDVQSYSVSIDQPFSFTQEDRDWGWVAFMRTAEARRYCHSDTLSIKCILQLKG